MKLQIWKIIKISMTFVNTKIQHNLSLFIIMNSVRSLKFLTGSTVHDTIWQHNIMFTDTFSTVVNDFTFLFDIKSSAQL